VNVSEQRPASQETEQEVPLEKWQALDSCWNTILGLEAGIETLRISMEGLRGEMERAFHHSLTFEERMNALQADVGQWTSAKNRMHYALPKVREFIHRATWAAAAPERKRLGELHKNHIEPRVPFPEMDRERERLEYWLKDRQVFLAQGNAAALECRGILAEIQRALGTLQRNAADNARRKAARRW
jgi:chromosome segregation ATPase